MVSVSYTHLDVYKRQLHNLVAIEVHRLAFPALASDLRHTDYLIEMCIRDSFTMAKFTIPDDKCLVVELNEKNGGRHQSFVIENEDLVRAGTINELQVR